MLGKNTALIKWVKDNFGHDKDKFPNGRKWSIEAGVHHHAVYEIRDTGKATPKTVVALARAAEISVLEGLIALGLITNDDLKELDVEITPEDLNLITIVQQLRKHGVHGQRLIQSLNDTAQQNLELAQDFSDSPGLPSEVEQGNGSAK